MLPNKTAGSVKGWLARLLTDPALFWTFASLVILGDAVLTQLVIHFVPFTEIDWETYMAQVDLVNKGRRDYAAITGPQGPLVYPAGHVYIHQLLHALTDSGSNRALLQQIYASLYLISLTLSCAIYHRAGAVPNWIVLFLALSKRLHSIFVLRFFNDCWSLVAVQTAVLAYQHGRNAIGTLIFSVALSIKMSILLYLPGLLLILFKAVGPAHLLYHVLTLLVTQIFFALPFLRGDTHSKQYFQQAFDLSRVFLYKWTVNWRFVSEETFLNPLWSRSLIVGHLSVLLAFCLFKWSRTDGGCWKVLDRAWRRPSLPSGVAPVTADYIATVLFTSNLIGITFSRSLHYQFYSWYAQQVPFLAWRTRYPLAAKLCILIGIEYAWFVFPSTTFSSGVLLGAHVLLLIGIWFGDAEGRKSSRYRV